MKKLTEIGAKNLRILRHLIFRWKPILLYITTSGGMAPAILWDYRKGYSGDCTYYGYRRPVLY